ncbi:MAG TPA: 4-(cytidine 5'-diphospho)-2-C-methyl-D-erythritol kinase [Thermodesulfobacteriota bacterium]|nr:4-(cytidine 5'-diphospho)-2-C-methyl-D-erythritol kinase [Thermodesulfobacteriota bacterium]
MRLTCPAKVNLTLEVLGRRADGYHEIRSVMVPISLADELVLRAAAEPGVHLTVEGADLPTGPDNLVHRAATLFFEALAEGRGPGGPAGRSRPGGAPGVAIHLVKRIPVGAGLGGGSSDAAATLRGLARLFGVDLGEAALAALARRLGADVPFFLETRPALASGIGERLAPLPPLPPLWMVLLNPGFPVSTAWAYREFDALAGEDGRLTPPGDQGTIDRFLEGPAAAASALRNDLERATLRAYPVVAELKAALVASGALGALMAGSGPTVFGIFVDEQAARRGYERLRNRAGWLAFLACSI